MKRSPRIANDNLSSHLIDNINFSHFGGVDLNLYRHISVLSGTHIPTGSDIARQALFTHFVKMSLHQPDTNDVALFLNNLTVCSQPMKN